METNFTVLGETAIDVATLAGGGVVVEFTVGDSPPQLRNRRQIMGEQVDKMAFLVVMSYIPVSHVIYPSGKERVCREGGHR